VKELSSEALRRAVESLEKVRGVLKARTLSQLERTRVLELEERSRVEVKGLGKLYNEGVFECLKREHVIAILTNEEFKWPKGPYALIKLSGEVVAEIGKCRLKVFKERLRSARKRHKEYKVVFPPLTPPVIKPFNKFRDVVLASPSPKVHKYLLKLFNVKEKPNLGTMLVGFNDIIDSKL